MLEALSPETLGPESGPLLDHTLRTVVLGTAAIGSVSGALGCFAYLRRQSLVGDVVAHSSLAGIVVAFLLSHWITGSGSKQLYVLIPGAVLAGTAALLLSRTITTRTRLQPDCALGVMLAIFFGSGVMLLRWLQRRQPAFPGQAGLDGYLFGSAATVTHADLWMVGGLGLLAIGVVLALWHPFKVFTFDPQFAHSLGLPTRALDTLLLTILVVGVVIGIQVVGVILMIALFVTPAAAARQWTRHLGPMVLLAAIFGATAGVVGALISASAPRLPTGPVIVLTVTAIFTVSLFVAPRGLLPRRWRRRGSRSTAAIGTAPEVIA